MTQKRGLGRGLGALIPGAGSPAPAPEPELRTRTRPAGENSSSSRPVDMFFSGEQVERSEERAQRRSSSRDLANDMARAAAERRGRGTAKTTAKGRRSSGDTETADGAEDTAKASTRAPRTSGGTKRTTTTSAGTGTAAKSTGAKSTSAKSTGKSAASKSAGTKRSGTTTSAAKTSAGGTTDDAPSTSTKTTAQKTAPQKPAARKTTARKTTARKPAAKSSPGNSSTRKPSSAKTSDATADQQVNEPMPESIETVDQAPETDLAETIGAAQSPTDPAVTDEGTATAGASSAVTAEQTDEVPSEAPAVDEPRELVSVPGAEFAEIPIHEIRENPRNPRTLFDEDELDELAYSLREVGVLQPVVVRPIPVTADGESFELVMGERRWRAARRAGLPAIPAIIRETSDDDLLRDALLENLHRSQLNPLEEANAYQQLLDDFGCTQDELGERIGRSRPQITNTLRLLRLPALVQRRLASGAISAGHARALLSLDSPALMEELAQRIVSEGLSVRAVERLVARGGRDTTSRPVRRSTYDPHVVDLTSRLSNRLETPVRIDVGKRKGRITLEFTNLDDLDRLVESMGLDIPLPQGSADDDAAAQE